MGLISFSIFFSTLMKYADETASQIEDTKVTQECKEFKDMRNKWNETKQTTNTMTRAKFIISSAVNGGREGSSGVINCSQASCVPPSQHKHQRIHLTLEHLR